VLLRRHHPDVHLSVRPNRDAGAGAHDCADLDRCLRLGDADPGSANGDPNQEAHQHTAANEHTKAANGDGDPADPDARAAANQYDCAGARRPAANRASGAANARTANRATGQL